MPDQNSTLTFRVYPWVAWFIGAVFLVVSATLLPALLLGASTLGVLIILAVLAAGLLFLLLAGVLTVTADRGRQMLALAHWSPLRRKTVEIPFAEIAAVQVEAGRSYVGYRGAGSGPAYRLVAIKKDGQSVPFTTAFTSGSLLKEKRARQLREFIGVGGADAGYAAAFQAGQQMAQQAYTEQQEALTGPEDEEHVTDGVRWHLKTGVVGAMPYTRWVSRDFCLANDFLFISQKPAGSGRSALFEGVNKLLFQQSLPLFGFGPADTPDLAQAGMLPPIDPRFEHDYMAFTANASLANQILNPPVVAALANWVYRFPLKRIQTGQPVIGQINVMFSPAGTHLSCMGVLIPEAVDELAKLGVALVKAQGSVQA